MIFPNCYHLFGNPSFAIWREDWDNITNTQQIKQMWEAKGSTSEVCYENQRSNWRHKSESGCIDGE